jgi:hypothetical protein
MYQFEPAPALGDQVRAVIETSDVTLTGDLDSAVSIGSSLLWELKHLEPRISDNDTLSAISAWYQAIQQLANLNEKDSAEYVKTEYARIHKPKSYKEALGYFKELSHFKTLASIFEQMIISAGKPIVQEGKLGILRLTMIQIGAFYFHITGLKPIADPDGSTNLIVHGTQAQMFASIAIPFWNLIFSGSIHDTRYEQILLEYVADGCPEYKNTEFLIEITDRQSVAVT